MSVYLTKGKQQECERELAGAQLELKLSLKGSEPRNVMLLSCEEWSKTTPDDSGFAF